MGLVVGCLVVGSSFSGSHRTAAPQAVLGQCSLCILRTADCEAQLQPCHSSCLAGADHENWNSLVVFGSAEIYLWRCCLWNLLDLALMLSNVEYVCCGIFTETVLQVSVRCCIFLALVNFFGTTSNPQFCGCLSWTCVYSERAKLCTKDSFYQHWPMDRSAKVPRHPDIHFCLHLPMGCLFGSVTERTSGGVKRVGLKPRWWHR